MQKDDKAVVLGKVSQVQLWRFELEVKDRRTGDYLTGETVEVGNEDYDLGIAERNIRQQYGALGYEITDATFKEERIFIFDTLKAWEQADESTSGREPQRIEDDENEGSSWKDEINATLAELNE